jgi:hypothetical protein
MRSSVILACILAVPLGRAGEAVAAPAGPETTRAPKAAPAKRPTALELIAEEEKWVFRRVIGRPDVFVDLEAQLVAQRQAKTQSVEVKRPLPSGKPGEQPQPSDIEQLVAWARGEEERVRQMVAARRYEEAMKTADGSLKLLEPHLARPDVAPVVVSIRTYRAQAEEAKIRDDAQNAFENLKIKVLGVLWSQDGMRMAIIDGENRALSVNDRVKDCAVINIDQDRVDFRFVFGRRRFEFPVYVDQLARAKP